MSFDFGAALGGLFGLGSAFATSEYGKWDNIRTNDANIRMNAETNAMNKQIADEANALQLNLFNKQMDYTRQTQQTEWERADSSLQRAVADASNAGLSPLSVLTSGGAPSGNLVSQPSAPQMNVPTMHAAQMNPMNPAYFLSMNDAARAAFDIIKDDRHMSSQEKIEKLKQTEENSRFEKQLRTTTALTNKQLNLENSRKSKELQEQIREFNKNLEFTVTEANRKYKLSEMDTLSAYVMKMTGNSSGAYRKINDYSTWTKEIASWADSYAEKSATITANYESYSKGASGSGSLGGGFGPIKADISGSGSSSETKTQDFSEYWKHNMASWVSQNPMPVYFGN